MDMEEVKKDFTRKNCSVEPFSTTPYFILFCFDRSSALSIGLTSFSTVKKAAEQARTVPFSIVQNISLLPKLAVYDEMRIKVKNHQIPETRRVDIAEGLTSEP